MKVGKYKVVDYVAQHNHCLQPLGYVHTIHSHWHIFETQASQIAMDNDYGLKQKDFCQCVQASWWYRCYWLHKAR